MCGHIATAQADVFLARCVPACVCGCCAWGGVEVFSVACLSTSKGYIRGWDFGQLIIVLWGSLPSTLRGIGFSPHFRVLFILLQTMIFTCSRNLFRFIDVVFFQMYVCPFFTKSKERGSDWAHLCFDVSMWFMWTTRAKNKRTKKRSPRVWVALKMGFCLFILYTGGKDSKLIFSPLWQKEKKIAILFVLLSDAYRTYPGKKEKIEMKVNLFVVVVASAVATNSCLDCGKSFLFSEAQ